jgi:hypothetical protein
MPDDDSSDTPESLAARQATEAHRARYPVEAAYTPPGPRATTTSTVTDGCWQCDLRPVLPPGLCRPGVPEPDRHLGQRDRRHTAPVLHAVGPPGFLRFSVIGTTSRETGSGVEIGDAAHYLVTQAGTAGSVFYGNLDVNRVAAVGHSQGAGGATRAALNDPALIKTLMTFSLPITYWLNGPSIAQLTQPVFLSSTHGIFDSVIAPPVIERIFYETLTVPAALGLRGIRRQRGPVHAR